jgi:hypothetical protein
MLNALDLAIIALCIIWGVAGFTVCRMTHQDRGIKHDPWAQVVVPDFPPDGLILDPDAPRDVVRR